MDEALTRIAPMAELGNLHDVADVKGQRIRMRFQPEAMIVQPR